MNVYLYCLDTLADWEVGFITAEFGSRRYFDKGKEHTPLMRIGPTKEEVKTMGGMGILPEASPEDVVFKAGDILILPGADTWMERKHGRVLDAAAWALDSGVFVAAICGATAALAGKGLLNRRRHTSNDLEYLKMTCPGYSGSDFYVSAPAVVDGNLITATGLAPLEFSYEVFKACGVMREKTLSAWYKLYAARDPASYYALMESLA